MSDAEYMPGQAVRSDDQLARFARERGGTLFYPSGTCRMGSDARSVVDTQLRVRGVQGPRLVSTNINAATIMIGEKGASLMTGK